MEWTHTDGTYCTNWFTTFFEQTSPQPHPKPAKVCQIIDYCPPFWSELPPLSWLLLIDPLGRPNYTVPHTEGSYLAAVLGAETATAPHTKPSQESTTPAFYSHTDMVLSTQLTILCMAIMIFWHIYCFPSLMHDITCMRLQTTAPMESHKDRSVMRVTAEGYNQYSSTQVESIWFNQYAMGKE